LSAEERQTRRRGAGVYEEEEGIFFEDLSGQVLHDDTLARLLTLPNVLITSHQAFLTARRWRTSPALRFSNWKRSSTASLS